jgi:hypothetical protein
VQGLVWVGGTQDRQYGYSVHSCLRRGPPYSIGEHGVGERLPFGQVKRAVIAWASEPGIVTYAMGPFMTFLDWCSSEGATGSSATSAEVANSADDPTQSPKKGSSCSPASCCRRLIRGLDPVAALGDPGSEWVVLASLGVISEVRAANVAAVAAP